MDPDCDTCKEKVIKMIVTCKYCKKEFETFMECIKHERDECEKKPPEKVRKRR